MEAPTKTILYNWHKLLKSVHKTANHPFQNSEYPVENGCLTECENNLKSKINWARHNNEDIFLKTVISNM